MFVSFWAFLLSKVASQKSNLSALPANIRIALNIYHIQTVQLICTNKKSFTSSLFKAFFTDAYAQASPKIMKSFSAINGLTGCGGTCSPGHLFVCPDIGRANIPSTLAHLLKWNYISSFCKLARIFNKPAAIICLDGAHLPTLVSSPPYCGRSLCSSAAYSLLKVPFLSRSLVTFISLISLIARELNTKSNKCHLGLARTSITF